LLLGVTLAAEAVYEDEYWASVPGRFNSGKNVPEANVTENWVVFEGDL
jgi:hypothetical protein